MRSISFSRIRAWKAPLLIGGAVAAYIWVALSGPQGLQSLLDKHRQIRELQERNSEMLRQNEERKERIHRLEQSQSEQEMEIRKQLKKLREGETSFILPDAKPEPDVKSAPAAPVE